MKAVIDAVGPYTLRFERDRFGMLVRSIISQQISTSAARSIRKRLEDRVGTIEVVLFPACYRACAGVVGQEVPHVVRGLVQERQGEVVVVAEAVWGEP